MKLPSNYLLELTHRRIKLYFPNLMFEENFIFTSLKTDEYNCVAWALDNNEDWIEFDLNVEDYINYFSNAGFKISETEKLVEGVEKIAIYADSKNQFTHIARQLSTGKWTSKLGEWEDIEHNDLEAISGNYYGKPVVFMQK